jgi:hypothetical protein
MIARSATFVPPLSPPKSAASLPLGVDASGTDEVSVQALRERRDVRQLEHRVVATRYLFDPQLREERVPSRVEAAALPLGPVEDHFAIVRLRPIGGCRRDLHATNLSKVPDFLRP